MRVRRLLSGAALLLTSATLLAQDPSTGSGQGQSKPPQFKAGVELIQLDVVVLDDKRQPVSGLTQADFSVLDEGKPTPIRAFTPVELATTTRASDAVWASEVPPDVVTNQVGTQEGRLVIIVLDRTIPAHGAARAHEIARAAVNSLGPNDLAAVVSTANNAIQDGRVQNLTNDRVRLMRAITIGDPATGISPGAEAIMGKQDPMTDPRCICGVCVHEALTRVADAVREVPRRRKMLLFIGSDMVWQYSGPVGASAVRPCELTIKDARAAMFAAVDRANLTIHSIDPQGLLTSGPQTQGGAGGARGGPDNAGPNQRLGMQQQGTFTLLNSRDNLNVLPNRTGGRLVVGRNNPEETVPEIFRESDAYYVLGIERAASSRPNGTRSLEVKVAKRGLRVVSQRLYGAPSAPADPLTALLPSGGQPLSLSVMSFANPGDGKSIVRMNVDAGAFARPDGDPAPLEVLVLAVDRTGKQVASARQTSIVRAPASTASGKREVNVQSQLELDPGEYGLRVSITDPGTGNAASVFADTTVPEFESAPISLSGVSVEAPVTLSVASSAGTLRPTTNRTFTRHDHVRAVLQLYQGTRRTDPILPVSLRVQILDAGGRAIEDQSLPFPETLFTNRRTDCVITLPLARLSAGEYLLKLDASSSRHTSGRGLRFSIR